MAGQRPWQQPGEPRWGWHQLAPTEARRLVADAGISRGDLVLDIGAGTGALTAPLLDAGARVVAFELHPGRARALRARFPHHALTVVQADVTDIRLPTRPFRVVANPPFAATTAILRRLMCPSSRLVRADLIVPAYAGARWSRERRRGASRFDIATMRRLGRGAFSPPPPRDTVVLVITRRT